MGGISTLQGAVLGDDVNKNATSFDLRSWQGLTLLLKTGKEHLTAPGAYAEFRNLVLQYAQQGGDVEIKKQIDRIIATFEEPQKDKNMALEVETEVPPTSKTLVVESNREAQGSEKVDSGVSKMIGRRMAPQFGMSGNVLHENDMPSDLVNVEESIVATAPNSIRIPVASHIVEAIVVSEPESVKVVPKTLEEYRARITEIKRAVHEHVGNPVALMGTKDGKGKVYMSALLGALKATGAGAGGGADSAMLALEKAYADLIFRETITPSEEPNEVIRVQEQKEESNDSVEQLEEQSVPVILEPRIVEVQEETKKVKQEDEVVVPTEEPVFRDVPLRRDAVRSSFKRSDNTIASVVSAMRQNKRQIEVSTTPILPNENNSKTENEPSYKLAKDTSVPPPPSPLPPESIPQEKVALEEQSEAQHVDEHEKHEPDTHLKQVILERVEENELPHEMWQSRGTPLPPDEEHVLEEGIDPKQFVMKQAELSSPEVAAMLDSLLHEWNIFSGSGLFGIGPGGLAHPLFRKLAPLSMGEVLAGRWEGTDPKIVKVIKQYVDAWRHEQGITFTTNETFEHYLRRVVQRILKRQGVGQG